ncbi:hypothetical protein DFJ58DRAFT_663286, partial [Suillus subalutaceus]|uniref:uncharacterized protein n=1 Tax=Suillus subalutaceus TaxID=48586 RepID=UPI001B860601
VIPAEMCVIAPDQRYARKLPPEFSPTMVKFSSKNPQDRLALISAGINNSGLDYQNSPFLQDAGITVSPDPISVTGRVLPTPKIHYGNPASSRPVVSPGRFAFNSMDTNTPGISDSGAGAVTVTAGQKVAFLRGVQT